MVPCSVTLLPIVTQFRRLQQAKQVIGLFKNVLLTNRLSHFLSIKFQYIHALLVGVPCIGTSRGTSWIYILSPWLIGICGMLSPTIIMISIVCFLVRKVFILCYQY